jgi:hypothetical protein
MRMTMRGERNSGSAKALLARRSTQERPARYGDAARREERGPLSRADLAYSIARFFHTTQSRRIAWLLLELSRDPGV